MLLARVGHLVVCDLVNGSVFGHLGRKLKGIAGLTRADLDHLVSWIEAGPGAAREVTLVATLAAVAAAGRVLLAAVPGVQPVTVIAVEMRKARKTSSHSFSRSCHGLTLCRSTSDMCSASSRAR